MKTTPHITLILEIRVLLVGFQLTVNIYDRRAILRMERRLLVGAMVWPPCPLTLPETLTVAHNIFPKRQRPIWEANASHLLLRSQSCRTAPGPGSMADSACSCSKIVGMFWRPQLGTILKRVWVADALWVFGCLGGWVSVCRCS